MYYYTFNSCFGSWYSVVIGCSKTCRSSRLGSFYWELRGRREFLTIDNWNVNAASYLQTCSVVEYKIAYLKTNQYYMEALQNLMD